MIVDTMEVEGLLHAIKRQVLTGMAVVTEIDIETYTPSVEMKSWTGHVITRTKCGPTQKTITIVMEER